MLTGGGGGGGEGDARVGDGDGRHGGGDDHFVQMRSVADGLGGGDLVVDDSPEPLVAIPPSSPPRSSRQKGWTSAGNTWSEDPLSHYVDDE